MSFTRALNLFALGLIAISYQKAFSACIPNSEPVGYRFPVVLQVPPAFFGTNVGDFEAWSFQKNQWKQIAIQVDERNSEGSYVLEHGQPFTKDTDNGFVDANDELSILGRQLGDLFEKAKVPFHIVKRLEKLQRLDVCVDESYVGSVLIGASVSTTAKVSWKPIYDHANQRVDTPAYRYDFNRTKPMLVGNVFLKSGGKEWPVFADSTFIMPIIPKIWILPGTTVDESDFQSEIECWRSGPVRSIVAVGAKMKKFFSLVQLHLFSELVFYEDFFQIPTQIEMIFDATSFLDFGSGLAYVLRFPPGGSWKISSNLAELPPTTKDLSRGKNQLVQTAEQVSPNGEFRAWGSRDEGSFLAQVHVDSKALGLVPPPFLVRESMFDAAPWKNGWGWLRGIKGNLGVFLDISRVRKGTYDFTLDLMLSHQANDGFTDFRPVNSEWQNL